MTDADFKKFLRYMEQQNKMMNRLQKTLDLQTKTLRLIYKLIRRLVITFAPKPEVPQ
jgi:hypothetical protein